MKAELYTTPAVFDSLSKEWDGLLNPDHTTDFFMSLGWQQTWWKYLGRGELCIVSVRDSEGQLHGIGSWFIEEQQARRIVRTIGCADVSDYLGILARPECELEVFDTLMGFMNSQSAPQWDAFELCNVPQDSPTLTLLPEIAQKYGLHYEVAQEDVCPVVSLPNDYEVYLNQLDKKQRHELRRKRRRAEEYGVSCYVVSEQQLLNEEIDEFFSLMAMSTPDKAVFMQDPAHQAFFREMGHVMLEQGSLILMFLTIEGQRAAAMWQFAYHNRMMLYNSGLNPAAFAALSPGIVLLTYSIEDAIQRGCTIYDFLQGDEEYKYRMGAATTTVHTLRLQRSS